MNNLGQSCDCFIGSSRRPSNAAKRPISKQFPSSFEQRWERQIGIRSKELFASWAGPTGGSGQVREESIDRIRPTDVNARFLAESTRGMCWDEDSNHILIVARRVISIEISDVRRGLVEIRTGGRGFAFQLDNDDRSADQENDVWTASIEREFVFEDC